MYGECYQHYNETCPASNQACREAVWMEHRYLLGTQSDMDDIATAISKVQNQAKNL
jgi:hypothetical protein